LTVKVAVVCPAAEPPSINARTPAKSVSHQNARLPPATVAAATIFVSLLIHFKGRPTRASPLLVAIYGCQPPACAIGATYAASAVRPTRIVVRRRFIVLSPFWICAPLQKSVDEAADAPLTSN